MPQTCFVVRAAVAVPWVENHLSVAHAEHQSGCADWLVWLFARSSYLIDKSHDPVCSLQPALLSKSSVLCGGCQGTDRGGTPEPQ